MLLNVKELKNCINSSIKINEPLRNHTTFKIGGIAEFFIRPISVSDIIEILNFVNRHKIHLFVLGGGSKLLIPDEGILGITLCIKNTLNNIEKIDDSTFKFGAGNSLSKILNFTLKRGLSGFEFAAGIPGTLGGAITMNAGTNLGTIQNITDKVNYVGYDGSFKTIDKKDCKFRKRQSIFQQNIGIITSTVLRFHKNNKKKIKKKIDNLIEQRKKTQPYEYPSVGSVFVSPTNNYPTGKLIEQAGLKGLRKGNAAISEKHANFIINLGGATYNDVLFLIEHIEMEIKRKFNIDLKREVRVIKRME